MNHTELKAIDDLKAALIDRKDEALAKAFVALAKGDMDEYQRQFAVIEDNHTLIKAMATYVWSDLRHEGKLTIQ